MGRTLSYIALTGNGYHLVTVGSDSTPESIWIDPAASDDLSFATGAGHLLMERALSPHSVIVDAQAPTRVLLNDARDPMLSGDGESLAFVRDRQGRGQLMARNKIASDVTIALTPPSLNVFEATYLSQKGYAFSAVERGQPPQIYLTDATHQNAQLALGEARYPALSADGRWMAYSHLDVGVWNLWVRNEQTGVVRRIAEVPCNQIQSAWESDSKTLLYSTDCGRSLWFTALARRRVIP